MVTDITERKRAEEDLFRLNTELEERVKSRTRDLEANRAELEESQNSLMNIVEDLNEKTAELEKANVKLQELDRLKSLFIASMSHELRTPLNSVIGFSSVILNEWVGPINAEQKENLAIILRSGKHLLSLINDVIDVSKIEAGKIESFPEEFDLHDMVFEAVRMVEKELEEKGLFLRVTVTHQRMLTDRGRLLQCVLNLLTNAVKFTERGALPWRRGSCRHRRDARSGCRGDLRDRYRHRHQGRRPDKAVPTLRASCLAVTANRPRDRAWSLSHPKARRRSFGRQYAIDKRIRQRESIYPSDPGEVAMKKEDNRRRVRTDGGFYSAWAIC